MNQDRRALGRGLGALINPASTDKTAAKRSTGGVIQIPVTKIVPNPSQPRRTFRMDKLLELTDSIKTRGIIQPLVVRNLNSSDTYQIIAGERRFRAAKMAGLTDIPVIERNINEDDLLETALIENIQREDLNPIEEAEAYSLLLTKLKFTQDELAKRLGKSRVSITNSLRLLRLSEDIRQDIVSGDISAGHARALLSIEDDAEKQGEIRKKILENSLSVRETERIIKNLEKEKSAGDGAQPETVEPLSDNPKQLDPRSAQLIKLSEELTNRLAAKTVVTETGDRGKIIIHFNGADECSRIVDLLQTLK